MECYRLGDLMIVMDKRGAREYTKVSYPLRYGRYSEILSPEYRYQFNLNGELKFMQGRSPDWPHPAEWLKRTAGGDWIYYSSGEYGEVFDLFGEYYVPRLSYRSNAVFRSNPFEKAQVKSAIRAWGSLWETMNHALSGTAGGPLRDFLTRVCENDPTSLAQRAERLHAQVGGRVTVLPPETRHVDYDVLPLAVADGCLYHCGFCSVKSAQAFRPRSTENIREQIKGLRAIYARDLANYNALFLAHHDALAAGGERIAFAATQAYDALGLAHAQMKGARLFLFGSAESLTRTGDDVFRAIDGLPFHTYINIGLESADPETLEKLQKPITARFVEQAFERMLEINRGYANIEVSANFVFGGQLPSGHVPSLVSLTRGKLDRFWEKGGLYLSPLLDGAPLRSDGKRDLLTEFREVKRQARLPTYLYLIQRL